MGILTEDMKRAIREQRLGYVATVCEDGTPNLSPKGTLTFWDDDHLMFADLASPGTIANLRHNPAVEINVVDPLVRKGYRFKGTATVLTEGPQFEQMVESYRQRGTLNPIHAIVFIHVIQAQPLISPAYDLGAKEEEIRHRWLQYWTSLWHSSPTIR